MSERKRRVVILGATGSIGSSAAKVARGIPDRMEIVGLAARHSARKLAELANEFRPSVVCIAEESQLAELKSALLYAPRVLTGTAGLLEIATIAEADMVLVSIIGVAGLQPALEALKAGKDLAVASKEILVMAGECVMREAQKNGCKVLPVDSEHNAVFQCLENRKTASIRRIILTASGGPFRTLPASAFGEITVEQALRHPTWSMGKKITIDSATLFNKGLEMLEARWLFDVPMHKIDVVVHPQSIVHSMVEFIDNSILAQMSRSDMCFPIHYAVTWPDRVRNTLQPLDFTKLGKLEFEAPRTEDFPALRLARRAGEQGGTLPAVLNAANEIAVSYFLKKQIPFPEIWEMVERAMGNHRNIENPELADIIEADRWTRELLQKEKELR